MTLEPEVAYDTGRSPINPVPWEEPGTVKKTLISAALVASLSLVAVACDDGDDATPEPTEPAPVEAVEEAQDAAEEVEAEVDEAADEAEEMAEDAANEAVDEAQEGAEAVDEAVDEAEEAAEEEASE